MNNYVYPLNFKNNIYNITLRNDGMFLITDLINIANYDFESFVKESKCNDLVRILGNDFKIIDNEWCCFYLASEYIIDKDVKVIIYAIYEQYLSTKTEFIQSVQKINKEYEKMNEYIELTVKKLKDTIIHQDNLIKELNTNINNLETQLKDKDFIEIELSTKYLVLQEEANKSGTILRNELNKIKTLFYQSILYHKTNNNSDDIKQIIDNFDEDETLSEIYYFQDKHILKACANCLNIVGDEDHIFCLRNAKRKVTSPIVWMILQANNISNLKCSFNKKLINNISNYA